MNPYVQAAFQLFALIIGLTVAFSGFRVLLTMWINHLQARDRFQAQHFSELEAARYQRSLTPAKKPKNG